MGGGGRRGKVPSPRRPRWSGAPGAVWARGGRWRSPQPSRHRRRRASAARPPAPRAVTERAAGQPRRARAPARALAAPVREALKICGRANSREVAPALPDGPLEVTFAAERIVQVVLNLLENAVKYPPATAAIAVSLARAGEVARLEVRDHGPGLS